MKLWLVSTAQMSESLILDLVGVCEASGTGRSGFESDRTERGGLGTLFVSRCGPQTSQRDSSILWETCVPNWHAIEGISSSALDAGQKPCGKRRRENNPWKALGRIPGSS